MKKVINILLIAIAIILLFTASVVVKANQESKKAIEETGKQKSDYVLPYPGILPDSPLYFIKMVRDRVVGWLITDPVKKAEYNLLMADKRINAGLMLISYGKEELGETTISKGRQYLVQGVDLLNVVEKHNRDALVSKFRKASGKHIEELKRVQKNMSSVKAKKGIGQSIEQTIKVEKRLERITSGK